MAHVDQLYVPSTGDKSPEELSQSKADPGIKKIRKLTSWKKVHGAWLSPVDSTEDKQG
jgi:hypothetical protein